MHNQSRGLVALTLWTGATLSAPPLAKAQSEIETLRQQITALTERLNKLEADGKKKAATDKATPNLTAKSPVVVSGLLQVHALGFLNQNGPGAKQADTFRLRRGEIRLTGQITPKLVGTIQLDPAKALAANSVTIPAGGGTVTPTINQSGNILQEIALQYQLSKTQSGANFLDIGQYKIPIGYESLVTSANLQNVERALMYTQRDPFASGYGDIRDTGVQLRGTAGQFDYRVGIFNGFGDRQNALATTDQKAVIGLVSYRPKSLDGLQLGLSGGTGSAGRVNRDILNAFAVYKKAKWTLQGEFLEGKGQGALGTPPVATLRDVRSYYGHLGYLFTPKVEGIFRYDYFDTNKNAANADGTDLTLGVNYYLKSNNAKVQLNIVRRNGDPTALTGNGVSDLRNDRYELRTNFQVAF